MRTHYNYFETITTIVKSVFVCIVIIGILYNGILSKKNKRINELEGKIEKYVYDEGWRKTENGKTLQFAINVKRTKFVFDEKEIFLTVQNKLNYHNRRVDIRNNNRNNGFPVTLKGEIYDIKLRAVFVKDYEFKGSVSDRVFLFSENVNNQFTKRIESEGVIIPVEYYKKVPTLVSDTTINNIKTYKGTIQQASPVIRYTLLDDSGADKLLSIGEYVALNNKNDIKYYNDDFSKHYSLSYKGKNLDDRVTKILDYRITEYNGGARLKEELNFPKGVTVDDRTIYNIRKGYRITIGKRVGDKYECTIPLKKQKSFKVLLRSDQFKPYDSRNWYLLEFPGQMQYLAGWVDGKKINLVRKK